MSNAVLLVIAGAVFVAMGIWVVARPERQARYMAASMKLITRSRREPVEDYLLLARVAGVGIAIVGLALISWALFPDFWGLHPK
jgi:preprotein translocase subunit Sss1